MADRKATLTAILVDSVSGPGKQIQATVTGIGEGVSKMNAILTGIGLGIGEQIFNKITNAVDTLAHALPNLIDAGDQYLEQLHQIQLETGMTAEQTSVLVGITKSLGISTDNLEPLFAKLGKSLGTNEGNFRALGVATRDSNGSMLGAFQIISNLREQVAKHGEALLSSAAAQALFGRGGYQLLPLLQLSNDAFKEATANVERWGGVMSQQAIDGAHKFSVELASLQTGILDVGTNIFAALSPYLTAFVDAFSRFVQAHLQEIINFAVSVAATITGFVSGLLGFTVDFSKIGDAGYHAAAGTDTFGKTVKSAASGTDAFTASINAQIKAIDAQMEAEQRATRLRAAARERERLDNSLGTARAQLADLTGNAPFLGGLSSAEQALAVQKHAQDVIDAQQNVHNAQTALADFEANQKDQAERELQNREKQRLQESLAAHKATNAAILDSGLRLGAGLDKGLGQTFQNIGLKTQAFAATAAASFKTGTDAARGFIDILLGVEQAGPNINGSAGLGRTGGVAGAIKSIGDALGGLGGALDKAKVALEVAAAIIVARLSISVAGAIINIASGFAALAVALGPAGALALAIGGILALLSQFPRNPLAPSSNQLPTTQPPGYQPWLHAAGGVFDTLAPTQIGNGIMGEAGGETVAIIANPRAAALGDTAPIHTHVYLDGRQIAEAVSQRLAFSLNHSPVTSLPNGSF